MKKILLLLLVAVYACQSPNGTVTTNDERSEIIKTLFKNVSEENIDYLKEVFSDDMTFVDSKNNTKDKAGFIAGIEGLFDMFEDISFIYSTKNYFWALFRKLFIAITTN
mgnify:CR=1 FL=1